jgi:hypothetical protein
MNKKEFNIPPHLLDAIRSYPTTRKVLHCGKSFQISPFEIYAICPVCREKIKVRSFTAFTEIEDVFDAVFEWMMSSDTSQLVKERQKTIENEARDSIESCGNRNRE